MNELEGRVAVVTGGASGIGRAMAELFARERAKVVVADIDERALAAVVESIRTRGGEALRDLGEVGNGLDPVGPVRGDGPGPGQAFVSRTACSRRSCRRRSASRPSSWVIT